MTVRDIRHPGEVHVWSKEGLRLAIVKTELVMAAPELLEVVRGFLLWSQRSNERTESLRSDARALLAKLEGGE